MHCLLGVYMWASTRVGPLEFVVNCRVQLGICGLLRLWLAIHHPEEDISLANGARSPKLNALYWKNFRNGLDLLFPESLLPPFCFDGNVCAFIYIFFPLSDLLLLREERLHWTSLSEYKCRLLSPPSHSPHVREVNCQGLYTFNQVDVCFVLCSASLLKLWTSASGMRPSVLRASTFRSERK